MLLLALLVAFLPAIFGLDGSPDTPLDLLDDQDGTLRRRLGGRSSVGWWASSSTPYSFRHKGHCAGGYMGGIVKVPIQYCYSRCKNTAGCGYFAYTYYGNRCALYTAAAGCPYDGKYLHYNSYELPGVPGGPPAGSTSFSFLRKGHCSGEYLGGWYDPKPIVQCYEKCSLMAGCGYFAHRTSDNKCLLYSVAGGCPNDGRYLDYKVYKMQ